MAWLLHRRHTGRLLTLQASLAVKLSGLEGQAAFSLLPREGGRRRRREEREGEMLFILCGGARESQLSQPGWLLQYSTALVIWVAIS